MEEIIDCIKCGDKHYKGYVCIGKSPKFLRECAGDTRYNERFPAKPKEEEKKTLRDEIAIAAMQGILSCTRKYEGGGGLKERVKLSFKYADEFLEQRSE